MREEPYADLGIYIMADKAILPTTADTPGLYTCQVEPVEVFDYRNRADFIASCKHAISRGISHIEMPDEDQMYWDEQGPAMKNPVVLKYANLSNWDEQERKSIYVKIECYPSGFAIEVCGRAKNGKWSPDDELDIVLKSDVGIEGAVDAILEHLRTRTDLPGLTFGPSRKKTAKGA